MTDKIPPTRTPHSLTFVFVSSPHSLWPAHIPWVLTQTYWEISLQAALLFGSLLPQIFPLLALYLMTLFYCHFIKKGFPQTLFKIALLFSLSLNVFLHRIHHHRTNCTFTYLFYFWQVSSHSNTSCIRAEFLSSTIFKVPKTTMAKRKSVNVIEWMTES